MPHADFVTPFGVFFSSGINRVAEMMTAIHQIIDTVQINFSKHRLASISANNTVIEPLWLPFD